MSPCSMSSASSSMHQRCCSFVKSGDSRASFPAGNGTSHWQRRHTRTKDDGEDEWVGSRSRAKFYYRSGPLPARDQHIAFGLSIGSCVYKGCGIQAPLGCAGAQPYRRDRNPTERIARFSRRAPARVPAGV